MKYRHEWATLSVELTKRDFSLYPSFRWNKIKEGAEYRVKVYKKQCVNCMKGR